MSAAGSLVGRKRERPAQSTGSKSQAGPKSASKTLERLTAAHAACQQHLAEKAYPGALSDLALALQQILEARLVVLLAGGDPERESGVAPAETDTRGWLEALGQQHVQERD